MQPAPAAADAEVVAFPSGVTIRRMPIGVEQLSVQRLGRPVLQDVSLHIGDGDCVSILGPNGAGKSTLMQAMLGLLPVEGGRVLIDGEPLARLGRRQIARRIAYVPQIHDGYLGFTAREVVETGRYAHLGPLDPLSGQDREAIEAAIEACHIRELLERPVSTLSGGERQKVWIASALAQRAPAVFLDEPTSALDPAHQADLLRIMRRSHAAGNTLLVICHDVNLPLTLGGRVVGMRGGRVLFDEPVGVLTDTARLADLYGTEFELHHDASGRNVSIHPRI